MKTGCDLVAVLLAIFVGILVTVGTTAMSHNNVVACYLSSWAANRPYWGRFSTKDVNSKLCTHIVYAFAGLNAETSAIEILDEELDIHKGGYQRTVALRQQNPKLKVILSVGGWEEGSEKYSNMSASQQTRLIFINSVVELLRKYSFDGLDVNWEYPANRGGRKEDKGNFIHLIQEMRRVFDHEGWLLTASVGAGESVMESAYDIPALSKYLHYIFLMTYDYNGKWNMKTGHNAPLYPRPEESSFEKTLNVNYTVHYYLQNGADPKKLILGLPFFGRTFLLNDTSNPNMGSASMENAFSGPYTLQDGYMGYNEICEKKLLEKGAWTELWHEGHQAPYMYQGNKWLSFDNANSIGLKVALGQRLGLGGVMIWSIDMDDFDGRCGKPYPLLESIHSVMDLHALICKSEL